MRWRPSPSISQTLTSEIISQSVPMDAQSEQTRLQPHKRSHKRSTVRTSGPQTPQTPRLQSVPTDTSILPGGMDGRGAAAAAAANAPGGVPAAAALFNAVRAKASGEGLSIAALAARCGISRPQLSNALAGRTRLSPVAMSALREYEATAPILQAPARHR
jgi:hypothetical protein